MRKLAFHIALTTLALIVSSTGLAAERCTRGQAWSPFDSRCVACTQPCKMEHLGQCRHGTMDCNAEPPACKAVVLPGERRERCDGLDNDCDGQIDEGFDSDADGYTTCSGDCDDHNAAIFPDGPELCDGIDNDCDGHVDEAFRVGRSCFVGIGSCRRKGAWRCSADGKDSHCDVESGEPSKELCDGLDNDCDGQVDEELGEIICGVGACRVTVPACRDGNKMRCVPGKKQSELCGDGIDNNCDGTVDEGSEKLNKRCEAGVGACLREGTFACSADKLKLVCDAAPGEPAREICGNRIDDDCDGKVDNLKGKDGQCDNGQLGACRREGTMVCDRSSGELICSAKKREPSAEVCDGVDNDCDGKVDEGLHEERECGQGACAGGRESRDCRKAVWTPWSACTTAKRMSPEVCDGIDNDCNGAVDDGLVETRKCGVGVCADGAEERICDAGAWGEWSACTTDRKAHAEICDEMDNDCDGEIDEGVINACGGCQKLTAEPGDSCIVEGRDACGVGVYACSEAEKGALACSPRFAQSNDTACMPDDNECTGDICRDGACSHLPRANGSSCDDANACTDGDMCIDGACVGGSWRLCDDRNPCTADNCDPLIGCAFSPIGDGRLNECGGCNELSVRVGEACSVEGMRGPCMHGTYGCMIDGEIACVQRTFPLEERCSGIDDDCDGEIDEDQGQLSCGDGACRVVVDRCRGGEVDVCVPLDPGVEDCTNTGTDDDCNGVIDDIPDLGRGCDIVMGMCVMPGMRGCEKGKVQLACVPLDPAGAQDADRDGIPNYCDSGTGKAEWSAPAAPVTLFDVERTRAFMLPWNGIADAVLMPREEEGDYVLAIAADRRSMYRVEHVRDLMKADAFAAFKEYPLPDAARCEDGGVMSIAPMLQGAAVAMKCRDGDRVVLNIHADMTKPPISELNGGSIDRVLMASAVSAHASTLAILAQVDGEDVIVTCEGVGATWSCNRGSLKHGDEIVFATYEFSQGDDERLLFIDRRGRVSWLAMDDEGAAEARDAGGVGTSTDNANGAVMGAAVVPQGGGRAPAIVLAGAKDLAVLVFAFGKDGSMRFVPKSGEHYGPIALQDDIADTTDTILRRPHALTPLRGSSEHQPGLFAAYEIDVGGSHIGAMGFIYERVNEPPRGGIRQLRFDGKVGQARLAFVDPTGEQLTTDVVIRAAHGGELKSWVDRIDDGLLVFSVKDDNNAVGLWPVTIEATATDSRDRRIKSIATINEDGTIESIKEMNNSQ